MANAVCHERGHLPSTLTGTERIAAQVVDLAAPLVEPATEVHVPDKPEAIELFQTPPNKAVNEAVRMAPCADQHATAEKFQ